MSIPRMSAPTGTDSATNYPGVATEAKVPVCEATHTFSKILTTSDTSRCVNPDGISWRAVWYRATCAPQFLICSYCYDHHIHGTSHADLFEAVWEDGNAARRCEWNTPRVMSHLASNDWDAIKAFMVQRPILPPCTGPAGHTGPDGSRWYSLTDAWGIQGFAICEACYHDLLIWNHLREKFTATPTIKSDEGTWTCDAALPLIREGLRRAITSPDSWKDLHLLFRRRLEYPSCLEMKKLQAGSTNWHSSKNVPELIVCTACYLDHFVLDYAGSWELLYLTTEQQQNQRDCAMLTVQISYAFHACKRVSMANNTNEFDGFEDLARIILNSPPCDEKYNSDTTWFTPKDYHGDEFAICKRCFIGFMVAPGFVDEFKQVSLPDNQNRTCDFHPGNSRFLRYFAIFEMVVYQNNFPFFPDFVSEYSRLPDCPRNVPYKNRIWYGKGHFTICELCYREAVEVTSLSDQLECAVVPNEARCQMYSARMRNLWAQACDRNDLASFLIYAKQRMDAYLIMNIEKRKIEFEEMQRLQQKHTLLLASTINQGTESIYGTLNGSDTTMYGNFDMGYHWHTPEGMEGEQQFQQAMGINVVQAGSSLQRMLPLMRRWAELE